MLSYALTFFMIALVAAAFGFWGAVGVAAGVGKVLCLIFVILAVVSMIGNRPGHL